VSRASEAGEKYEVASGASPVEHFELYLWLNRAWLNSTWLNRDELGFERSLALRRCAVLGKSCAGYQGKDSRLD
jgi:hypothetical protein